jgi:DNA-directed RNA polymerase specialized sigma24 family protein
MSSDEGVTQWVHRLKRGDRAVVEQLWQRYYRGLVGLARKKLGDLPRRARDEEDVALSAFDSFVRGAEKGRFPRLEDREDLWQLLVMITSRKVIDLAVYESRDRRDWRRLQGQADNPEESGALMRNLLDREPDPAFAVEVAEECRRLLGVLPDESLRQAAQLKLEGYTNEEIAERVGVASSTVTRWLALIRKTWRPEAAAPKEVLASES